MGLNACTDLLQLLPQNVIDVIEEIRVGFCQDRWSNDVCFDINITFVDQEDSDFGFKSYLKLPGLKRADFSSGEIANRIVAAIWETIRERVEKSRQKTSAWEKLLPASLPKAGAA